VNNIWQLQEAKSKFSEVVERALAQFCLSSPLAGSELVIAREDELPREIGIES
jgi:hypothetical protein